MWQPVTLMRHGFEFAGGDMLTTIGVTWFVSFAYCESVDRSHRNWERVTTAANRKATFERSREYHRLWLEEVAHMNPKQLSRNTIGVAPSDCKAMARDVLKTLHA